MPSENSSDHELSAPQPQDRQGTDFYPIEEQRSRDDIPSADVPLPTNSVVEKIMAGNTQTDSPSPSPQTSNPDGKESN